MKKFFILALMALGLSSVSSATVLQCSPSSANTVTDGVNLGPQVFTCGQLGSADGFDITNLTIFQNATAAVSGQINGTTYGLTFSMINNAGLTNDAQFTRSCVAGGLTNSCLVGADSAGGFNDIADVDFFPAFTVTITSGNLPGGTIVSVPGANSTAVTGITSVFVQYDEVLRQSQGVPEPSTFVLLGTALTGLGVVARRRKA